MLLAALIAMLLNLAVLTSDADTLRVAVAAQDLTAGSTLDAGAVEIVEIGDAGAIANGLTLEDSLDSVVGLELNRSIAGGEPIRRSDVRASAVDSPLREMSIEIERGRAVGGRLSHGDLVDVIAVTGNTSVYVAPGIEVIEIRDDEGGLGSTDGYTVIVSVDDRTALAIAAAEVNGVLQLTRSTGAASPTSGALTFDPASQP